METEAARRLILAKSGIYIPEKKEFIVANNFREGEENNGVPVGWLGPNFKTGLLPLVETGIGSITGNIYCLKRGLSKQSMFGQFGREKGLDNRSILDHFDGIGNIQTYLYHFHEYLKTASHSHWHFSYVVNGWTVFANWNRGHQGWIIGADRVDDAREWRTSFFNYHLFSRDFLAQAA